MLKHVCKTSQCSQLKQLADSTRFHSYSMGMDGKLKAMFLGSLAAGILAANEIHMLD